MKNQSFWSKLAIRWLGNSLGLWVAASLLSSHGMKLGLDDTAPWVAALIAGLFLALVNMFVRPLLVLLSIPALLLTLGLFMLVVNGISIAIVAWLYSSLVIPNFGVAVVAGIIVGLVNFLISRILEDIK